MCQSAVKYESRVLARRFHANIQGGIDGCVPVSLSDSVGSVDDGFQLHFPSPQLLLEQVALVLPLLEIARAFFSEIVCRANNLFRPLGLSQRFMQDYTPGECKQELGVLSLYSFAYSLPTVLFIHPLPSLHFPSFPPPSLSLHSLTPAVPQRGSRRSNGRKRILVHFQMVS